MADKYHYDKIGRETGFTDNGKDIYDVHGRYIGYMDKSEIFDKAGRQKGHVEGRIIYDKRGHEIGTTD